MKRRLLWILALAAVAIAVVYVANRRRPGAADVAPATPPATPAPTQFYPPAAPPPPVRNSPAPPPVAAPPAPTPSTPGAPPAIQPATTKPGSPSTTPPPSRPAAPPTPPMPATEEPPPDEAAAAALETLGLRVREFSLRFDGNPTGTNAEITAALTGKNPKGVRFLSGDQARVNENGELIDEWSTPYFFHALSASEMETRSAGPDKILWTDDDLVTR